MDKYDKLLKGLISRDSKDRQESTACLSEELFAAYLHNMLNDSDREKIETHLYQCSDCRRQSILLHKVQTGLEQEPLMTAPSEVTMRAKQLVTANPAKSIFEIAIKFAKDSIEILKDTGAMFTPLELAASGARQEGITVPERLVHLSKAFGDVKADLIIEGIDDNLCDINVKTSNAASGAPTNDLRINLLAGERELASYLTVKGLASFKNIRPGTYLLTISRGKDSIGEILLELESSQ